MIAVVTALVLSASAAAVVPAQASQFGQASSTLTVAPRGVPNPDRIGENRRFRHSTLEPTGRYVRSGEAVTVTVSGKVNLSRIAIGLYGAYAEINGGENRGLSYSTLRTGKNVVTADRDGLVFISNEGAYTYETTVEGGVPVPTLQKGITSAAEFRRQLAEYTESPFVSLIGTNVIGDFQRSTITPCIDKVTPELIESWDRVVSITNETYALEPGAAAPLTKSAARIYISNEDQGAGLAFATHDRISFHNKSSAGKNLFCRGYDNQWALWHEIGHTYQTPQYIWTGMSEVTVNIPALVIQERVSGRNNVDAPEYAAAVREFRKKPVGERTFAEIGTSSNRLFTQLLMFDQLRRGFGDAFYPRLTLAYRQMVATGVPVGTDDRSRIQTFMRTASTIADRNLARFFEEWGLHPDQSTRAEMAALPALTTTPWTNFTRATDVIENRVALRPTANAITIDIPATGMPVKTGIGEFATGQGLRIQDINAPAGIAAEREGESLVISALSPQSTDTVLKISLVDLVGLPVEADLSLHVVGAPVVAEDSANAYVGEPTYVEPLANDSGENLTLSGAEATSGSVEIVESTKILFTPHDATPDTVAITYEAVDHVGQSETGLVRVTVFPQPTANADRAVTEPFAPVELAVTENDLGRDLVLTSVSQPPAGTATILTGNIIRFDPGAAAGRVVRFEYEVADPNGRRAVGTITVEVSAMAAIGDSDADESSHPESSLALFPPADLASTGGSPIVPGVIVAILLVCVGASMFSFSRHSRIARRG